MVITEHQFEILAARYQLSPRQRQIARLLMEGLTSYDALCEALGLKRPNLTRQVARMGAKMHSRGVAQIVWRFFHDARRVSP